MKSLSPSEQKTQQRQTRSIVINIVIAALMIAFAMIATFFDFESLASKVVMASAILATSLLCLFLLVRWLKSLDEFESALNAKACLVAMFSSLLYLPLQYLSEIGLIPEIHITFLFMYIWFVYLIAIKYYHFK